MPETTKTMTSLQEMVEMAQSLSASMPGFGAQSAHFWQAQDMILQEFESYSSAWFKRRHEATRAAMQTSRALAEGGMGDPGAVMQALTQWQSQSVARLSADANACSQMMRNCAGALVSHEVEAVEEGMQSARSAVKGAKSHPV